MTHLNRMQTFTFPWQGSSSTRLFVIIQGTLFGIIGIIHGFYEILQGNMPTGGYLLDKIGAFTIIHNFLLTGIAAVCVGLCLVVWTIGFIHQKNGSIVFLFLAILLFLVGGGFAAMIFFIITYWVSTRMNRPLDGWKRILPAGLRERLEKLWIVFFSSGYLFLLMGIGIWLILTPPGTVYETHKTIYLICWSSLIIGLILQLLTIVSGYARDIEREEHP